MAARTSNTHGCGPSWQPAFGGRDGTDGLIRASTVFDDGSGRALIVGGTFTSAGGALATNVARWNGAAWIDVGFGGLGRVEALISHTDGGGRALYAGGTFDTIGGVMARGVARWDGAAWSALGSGIDGRVRALAAYDARQGPRLYAGGRFTDAGGVAAVNIAAWDGVSWSEVGGGAASWSPLTSAEVITLEAFDLFGPPILYVGGDFAFVGGQQAISIASWDGTAWRALGAGLSSLGIPGRVQALAQFDGGGGPELYAAGFFIAPGATLHYGVARWDGSRWSAVGASGTFDRSQHSLTVFDDGDGPELILGAGTITTQNGELRAVALWRGCPAAIGDVFCTPAVVNSTGAFAALSATGSALVAEDDVTLVASSLPLQSFGVFLTSTTRAFVPGYNGSAGTLCLGGAIGVYARPGEVQSSGQAGVLALGLDLASTPVPGGAIAVMPGDTWHFQVWYRDATFVGAVSNFSSGSTLQFE